MANGPYFAISVNKISRSYRPNSRDLRGSTAAICPVFRLCARPPTAPPHSLPGRTPPPTGVGRKATHSATEFGPPPSSAADGRETGTSLEAGRGWPSREAPGNPSTLSNHDGHRDERRRDDGQDRRPLQAARLPVPVLRDLRRPWLDVRLRPLRRPAQDERQERVVAHHDPGARRHRRP